MIVKYVQYVFMQYWTISEWFWEQKYFCRFLTDSFGYVNVSYFWDLFQIKSQLLFVRW